MVKDLKNLYDFALDHHYTVPEAVGLVAAYADIIGEEGSEKRDKYVNTLDGIRLARLIPVDFLRACKMGITKKTLFQFGIDTSKPYTLDVGPYMTKWGMKIGVYYIGDERTDMSWRKSGNATLDGMIETHHDKSMRDVLKRLYH